MKAYSVYSINTVLNTILIPFKDLSDFKVFILPYLDQFLFYQLIVHLFTKIKASQVFIYFSKFIRHPIEQSFTLLFKHPYFDSPFFPSQSYILPRQFPFVKENQNINQTLNIIFSRQFIPQMRSNRSISSSPYKVLILFEKNMSPSAVFEVFADPKINQIDLMLLFIPPYHYVFWLEVSMDYISRMDLTYDSDELHSQFHHCL